MKLMLSRLLFAAAISIPVSSFAVDVSAQAIEERRGFKFGSWAADPNASGTVVIPNGSDTTTSTGGVFSFGGTIKRARFRITGTPKAYVFILLPSSFTIRKGTTSNTMTVNNITMDRANPIRLNNSGVRTINLGGTLTVGTAQTKGNYNDDNTFTVSAFYN